MERANAIARASRSIWSAGGPSRNPPSGALAPPGGFSRPPERLLQRLPLGDLHLDQVGLRSLHLRQRDGQHAVLVRRLDLLRVDRGRQREGPLERAVGALI